MPLREWLALFLCVVLIICVWCWYVISLNKSHYPKAVHVYPMDLTVTYCESCHKCTTPEILDPLEFEPYDPEML